MCRILEIYKLCTWNFFKMFILKRLTGNAEERQECPKTFLYNIFRTVAFAIVPFGQEIGFVVIYIYEKTARRKTIALLYAPA